jgi:hypothetical protein
MISVHDPWILEHLCSDIRDWGQVREDAGELSMDWQV